MSKVTVEQEYLGHSFKLTFESDVSEDLSGFNVDERIALVMRRELQRVSEIVAVAVNDKRAAEELAQAQRAARQEGKFVVDATVGRGPRRFQTVDKRGPSVILGAGTKDVSGRLVVSEKTGRLLRSKPGVEIAAAEAEDGGQQ